MFYHMIMQTDIFLHPKYFGPEIKNNIKLKLKTEVEGLYQARHGFIIAVTDIGKIGLGLLIPGESVARFSLKFRALVFRPIKGEVLDGVVRKTTKQGLFIEIGPLNCFVAQCSISSDFNFCASSDCYRARGEAVVIEKDKKIRVRILGVKSEAKNGIAMTATIDEDHLGLIEE